jgi:uncharacterized protein (DUF2252 family)
MTEPTSSKISRPEFNPNYRLHPTQRNKAARAKHVVDALLDYNSGIIEKNPSGATDKFEKLKTSPFVFLRGTADLMYRDLFGTDANMSIVLCMGDVHLENYGVMEAEDRTLLWGLNDFDESEFAPFSWDVKRGVTSTVLAARDNGFGKKKCLKLAQVFAAAYLDTIEEALGNDLETYAGFTEEQSPQVVKKVIKKAAKTDPAEWLVEKYLQPESDTRKFRLTDEIQPLSPEVIESRVEDCQGVLSGYLASFDNQGEVPPTEIRVLDVATKTGSGTGSIGLWRFYVLADATRAEQVETVILELKQERPSVLTPYVGGGPLMFSSDGARVTFAEDIHLPNANPYYGYTRLDDKSYLVRERSPYKERVKLDKLTTFKKFKQYTKACGTALALAHTRSDRAFDADEDAAERRILQSINPDTFAIDIGRFAVRMADQVTEDWKSFLKACEAGTFTFPEPDAVPAKGAS